MLGQLAARIVDWQINRGTLKTEEEAVYRYAYELLLNQVINLILAGLVAFWFRAPVMVLLFLFGYIPLRSYSGGYHADTNLGCTILSTLMICGVCYGAQTVGNFILEWHPVLYPVSGIVICSLAPVQDHNKPLDEQEKARYQKRSRMIWGIEVLIGMLLYPWKRRLGFIVALSHAIQAGMLILGMLKNKRIEKNI